MAAGRGSWPCGLAVGTMVGKAGDGREKNVRRILLDSEKRKEKVKKKQVQIEYGVAATRASAVRVVLERN
jgi:hypothetical protein